MPRRRRDAEAGERGANVLGGQGGLDLGREGLVLGREDGRAQALELGLHQPLERRIADEVRVAADDAVADLGLGHQRGAVGDLAHARHELVQLVELAGADQVAHGRVRLHDVRRDSAGIGDRVVDAGGLRHVLAHVVDADVHQLDGVERAPPELRAGGGMGGAALELEQELVAGQRDRRVDRRERRRMPGDRDVDVVEQARAHQEALGGAAFLGRAAVVADTARRSGRRQPILDGRGREQRAGARAGCGRSRGPGRESTRGSRRATPAAWLSPGSASYSPRKAITGPPDPASPMTAVGIPARPVVVAKPSWRSTAACSAAARTSA